MYTNVRNVQILISLLKQFGIKHFVNSPGTRNTPLVHSIENDPFFICYSIVDERSAAYFALGIAEALNVPVCVTCTAATATCNYMPAIKEASERNIQLIALTADRELYPMFHMQDQSIDQIDMYRGYTKYSVDIPEVKNLEDEWFANRSINEALLELNHNGSGPIQINYRVPSWGDFSVTELKKERKIDRLSKNIDWNYIRDILKSKKKILLYIGSNYSEEYKNQLNSQVKDFFEKYNATVFVDHFSNIVLEDSLNSPTIAESLTRTEIDNLIPDLIITFGDIFYSPMKFIFDGRNQNFEHWHISNDAMVNDGFKNLTKIFECSAIEFLESVNKIDRKNDKIYYMKWKERFDKLKYPDLTFTNFSVIRDVVTKIPSNSIVHMSVLNSIRLSNYFPMQENVSCFANIGADGIDGALSTFLGQARKTNKLAFLIVGDLSYLYDLNASINIKDNNIRILVVNNYAGAEFHKNFGLTMIPTLNLHIAAGHHTKISQCRNITDAEYLSASNQDELNSALEIFMKQSDKPIILETFSDADKDAKTLKEYWTINVNEIITLKRRIKKSIKGIVGEKGIYIIKKILKRR